MEQHTGWLTDPVFYIPTEDYFELLQDNGEELIDEEKNEKTVSKGLQAQWSIYKKIYHLCKTLHSHYLKMKDTAFPDITTNRTNFVNAIGKYIFNNWYQQNRADIHSTPDAEFVALVRDEKFQFFDKFNMLSQARVLGYALSLWGVASDKVKMKNFTDDDRL